MRTIATIAITALSVIEAGNAARATTHLAAENHIAAESPNSTLPVSARFDWFRPYLGNQIGAEGLFGVDLDGDGVDEIIASATTWEFSRSDGGYWYAIRRDGTRYVQLFAAYPESGVLTELLVQDMDADTRPDIVSASLDGWVRTFDGRTFEERSARRLDWEIWGLAVIDLDRRGELDYVVVNSSHLSVYDVGTGTLRWRSALYRSPGVAAGDLDGDGDVEIVIADWGSTRGKVIDWKTRTEKWTPPGPFGGVVRVADVDCDGRDEIISKPAGVTVLDFDLRSVKYETRFGGGPVGFRDVNGDGCLDIAIGQYREVAVFDGPTGSRLWSASSPDYEVTGVAVGDTDGDGGLELVWGTDERTSGPDRVFAYDPIERRIVWQVDDYRGYENPEFADLDGDGVTELVHSSRASGRFVYDEDSLWFVLDPVTREERFRGGPTVDRSRIESLVAADLDGRPGAELLQRRRSYDIAVVASVDGVTGLENWRREFAPDALREVIAADVDADGLAEVVIRPRSAELLVLDGKTGGELRRISTIGYGAGAGLLLAAELDDDPARELVVVAQALGIAAYDGLTGEEQWRAAPVPFGAAALRAVDYDDDGRDELAVGVRSPASVRVLRGSDGALVTTIGPYGTAQRGVAIADVNLDGVLDYAVGLGTRVALVDGTRPTTIAWSTLPLDSRTEPTVLWVGDPNRDGVRKVVAQIGESGFAEFRLPEPVFHPPVADAGLDHRVECDGDRSGVAALDAGRSYDPDSAPGGESDIVSWIWHAGGGVLATGERASVRVPLGANRVTLEVEDRTALRARDRLWLTVEDHESPTGRITSPDARECLGPSRLPLRLEDSFTDRCDPDVIREYRPEPSAWNAHGDHSVALRVLDASGNVAEAEVEFTVDTRAPSAEIHLDGIGPILAPGGISVGSMFTTADEDGATGGVVREWLRFVPHPAGDPCTVLDGSVDGDGDGLLSDETFRLDSAVLCLAAERCGLRSANRPALRVEAGDCGGNIGIADRDLGGAIAFFPGLCGP